MHLLVLMLSALTLGIMTPATDLPVSHTDFVTPEFFTSPDARYQIVIPIAAGKAPNGESLKTRVIDGHTRETVAEIEATATWSEIKALQALRARWSADSSLVLWQTAPPHAPAALLLLRISGGELQWQANILQLARQALLELTEKAAPREFAAVKKETPDSAGFTIQVEALDPISLPLQIRTTLTSNPKPSGNHPNLDSHLEATIDEAGKLQVTSFALGKSKS